MKGKDLINDVVRVDMPDTEQVREECHRQAIYQNRREKRSIHRPVFAVAAAAVLLVCFVFGSVLFDTQSGNNNIFSLNAFAMEQQDDGSIAYKLLESSSHSVDISESEPRGNVENTRLHLGWGGFHDGKNLLMSVNLKVEGENIKHIDFYIDDGFFGKQYLKFDANGSLITDGVQILYVGENRTIASYGQDYEIIGSSFTVNKDDLTDDLLIFVGREDDRWGQRVDLLEKPFIVRAIATFNDGNTQEETLTFDFKEMRESGIIIRHFSDEELLQMTYDTTDMAKMEQAFINESNNLNIGEVRVRNIDVHNFARLTWRDYWMVTFDLLPEGETEWLLNQTQVVQRMSTDPVTRDIVVRFYND